MPFGNPIAAGITLIRTAIQSLGFVTGVSGWRLQRNGDAEFNNVTMRGTLLVTDPDGSYIKAYDEDPGDGAVIDFQLPTAAATTRVPGSIRTGTEPLLSTIALTLRGPNLDSHGVAAIYLASTGSLAGAIVMDAGWVEIITTNGISVKTDGDVELATAAGQIIWQVQMGTPSMAISMPLQVDGNIDVTGINGVHEVTKPGDETVNNSAVFQNDDDLFATVEPSATYNFGWEGFINSTAGASAKVQFAFGSGATGTINDCSFLTTNPGTGVTTYSLTNANGNVTAITENGTDRPIMISGSFTTTLGGTFGSQWAQQTATPVNTIMRKGSKLWVTRTA